MFNFLPEVYGEINAQIKELYWLMLAPFTLFVLVLEFFKMPKGNPDPGDILRRVVVSIILLLSFDICADTVNWLADGISERAGGIKNLSELLDHLSHSFKNSGEVWFKFREAIVHIMGFISYVVAYLGVFVAKVVVNFSWAILYVCSPLMILMHVWEKTAFVTVSLYKGLINVALWKVLWSILGVLLLKMTTSPQIAQSDNLLLGIVVNLCVGGAMLFIPLTAKSLIGDGLGTAATGMALFPTMATGKAIKTIARKQGRGFVGKGIGAAKAAPRAAQTKINDWRKSRVRARAELLPRKNKGGDKK